MPLHTRAAHTSSASLSSLQPQNQQTAFSFVLSLYRDQNQHQEDTHLYQQSNQFVVRRIKPGLHASIDPWQQDTPKTHEEKYPMTQCYISGHQK